VALPQQRARARPPTLSATTSSAARRTHNPILKAASERAGEGRWTIAANHIHDSASKEPIKALLWLSEWHERRTIASIIHIEGWETAKDQDLRNLPAASYSITICWIPQMTA
jgi:hypothetical protein